MVVHKAAASQAALSRKGPSPTISQSMATTSSPPAIFHQDPQMCCTGGGEPSFERPAEVPGVLSHLPGSLHPLPCPSPQPPGAERSWLLATPTSLFTWRSHGLSRVLAGSLGSKMPPPTTTPGHHPGETPGSPHPVPPLSPACLSDAPFSATAVALSSDSSLPCRELDPVLPLVCYQVKSGAEASTWAGLPHLPGLPALSELRSLSQD